MWHGNCSLSLETSCVSQYTENKTRTCFSNQSVHWLSGRQPSALTDKHMLLKINCITNEHHGTKFILLYWWSVKDFTNTLSQRFNRGPISCAVNQDMEYWTFGFRSCNLLYHRQVSAKRPQILSSYLCNNKPEQKTTPSHQQTNTNQPRGMYNCRRWDLRLMLIQVMLKSSQT